MIANIKSLAQNVFLFRVERPTPSIKPVENHLPYPQAQCDNCMAPTITVGKQSYTHVQKVVIKTLSVYKIIDAGLFGILLGSEKDGVVLVE